MRSLSKENKQEFIVFAIVVILIISVIVIAIQAVMGIEKQEYEVVSGTITFDKEYEIVETEQDGKIFKKLKKEYYLKEGNEEYDLGKIAICYNQTRNKLNIYGDTFEVVKSGEVTKYVDENEITNLSEDRLFKLEDRKYLVTGKSIINDTETISTKNFLIVQLDKTGNTLLVNYELNTKTINPIKLETSSFEFDVANEKLYFGEDEQKTEIDLKRIIGSTNEYKEVRIADNKKEENTIEEEKQSNENNNNNSSNNNSNNNSSQVYGQGSGYIPNQGYINQGQIINNAGTTTNNGSVGGNTNIQINNNGDNNSGSSQGQTSSKNSTPLAKSINLRGVSVTSTTLNVEYAILDAENKYQTVYLDIQGDVQKTIALDKTKNSYLITDLKPNTEYKVTLAYKEILKDNSIVDGVEDTIIARTSKISDSLQVTRLSKNRIYFTYKMDSNYAYDSGKIVLYIDGEKQQELEIDLESAVSNAGWQASVEYNYGDEFILKLEDVTYEGKKINRELQTKLKIY